VKDCSFGARVLAACLLFGTGAAAESNETQPVAQTNPTPLAQYRARELYLRYSWFPGLQLMRAGRVEELGYFGAGADEIFADSAAALESMRAYRTKRIVGTILYVAGLAAIVTDLVLLLADSNLLLEKDRSGRATSIKPLYWGLLIPGGVVGVTGGVLMQSANGSLGDAIDRYNHDLARRFDGSALPTLVDRGLRITLRGSF
jgi:hypothetical protein